MNRIIAALAVALSLGLVSISRAGDCYDMAIGILAMPPNLVSPQPAPNPKPKPSNICPNCKGTGKLGDGTVSVICPACNGSGKRTTAAEQLIGQFTGKACPCTDCKCKAGECGHPDCRSLDNLVGGRTVKVTKIIDVPNCNGNYCTFRRHLLTATIPISKLPEAQRNGWRMAK